MSSVSRPRGPLPPGVYWVRRLLVLAVALLLVLVVGKVLTRGSNGSSGGQAEQVAGTPTPTPTTSTGSASYGPTMPTPPTTPGTGRRHGGTTPSTPQATPSATLPAPTGPCATDDVVVTPVTGTPPAGGSVIVRLDVTTRTSLACTFAVSPQTVALKIAKRSGAFVWSTQACPAALPATTVIARRDVPGSLNVTWSGHYADTSCSAAGSWAVPGWYHAVASVLGGVSTDVQWQLGAPVTPTVTRTASPTGSPTGRASGQPTKSPVASSGSRPTTRPTGTASAR